MMLHFVVRGLCEIIIDNSVAFGGCNHVRLLCCLDAGYSVCCELRYVCHLAQYCSHKGVTECRCDGWFWACPLMLHILLYACNSLFVPSFEPPHN